MEAIVQQFFNLAIMEQALPLILSGVRSAMLQIIATATIAAYPGFGGLGRYIIDGLATKDFPSTIGGAVLVALLALTVQVGFTMIQRLIVSRGVSHRVKVR